MRIYCDSVILVYLLDTLGRLPSSSRCPNHGLAERR